jgi:hypothetical protein
MSDNPNHRRGRHYFYWIVGNASANPHNRSQLLQPSEILLLPFQRATNR